MAEKPTYDELELRVKALEKEVLGHRHAFEALRESEEKFGLVFESSNDVIIVHKAGTIKDVNRKASELTGYTREQLLNMSIPALFPEEYRTKIKDRLRKNMRAGATLFETKWQRADGRLIDVEVHSNDFNPREGTRVGITRDITDRKNAEKALRESEELFRTAFDHAALGMALVSLDGNFLKVNAYFCQMLGYTEGELLTKNFNDVTHPEDRFKSVEISRRVARDLVPSGVWEKRYLHRDGKVIWAMLSASLVHNAAGDPLYIVAHIQDITDRKRAEEALKDSENRYKVLFESAGDGIYVHDFDGNMLDVNQRQCELLGYTREEYLELNLRDIIGSDIAPLVPERMNGLQETGSLFIESSYIRRNGARFPIEANAKLIEYRGKPAVLAIIRDISERKAAEEEKAKLEVELQQARKMESIGTLAGGIAHDFNNILTPIMIHSEMAMMELPPDHPVQQNIRHIYKAGERARGLVKQILTFARKRKEKRVPIKASLIVKETIEFLRSTIPSTIDIRGDLRAEHDIVLADPAQINQIVLNLCTNATHAMRDKGGVLKVELRDIKILSDGSDQSPGLIPGKYLELTVSDTGSGIAPDMVEKIFEPYFTTKGPGEGTGMGLAVIHGIVKSYGGGIVVKSEPGKGSTFHVLLPSIESEAPPIIEPETDLPRGTEKILFVDDEESAVDTIQPMLERLGYRVTTTTSSLEALKAFSNKPDAFDLVITDQTMPGMSGKNLAEKLMAVRSDISIILCTGFSEQIDENKAREMGIKAFVMKPFVMREMAETIRKVLDITS